MEYPVTFNGVVLSDSVMADVTVSCTNNVQRADILFYSPVRNIGSITLTPMQPQASEKEFYAGNQKLHINKITFSAAFGVAKGQIICEGYATDQNGNDPAQFNFQLAQWG